MTATDKRKAAHSGRVIAGAAEKRSKVKEQKDAIAALARMHDVPAVIGVSGRTDVAARRDAAARVLGMRPLKPPPFPLTEPTDTAASRALREDRRRGLLGDTFRLGDIDR